MNPDTCEARAYYDVFTSHMGGRYSWQPDLYQKLRSRPLTDLVAQQVSEAMILNAHDDYTRDRITVEQLEAIIGRALHIEREAAQRTAPA